MSASAADFGARYRSLLDDTAAVRAFAQKAGDPRLTLQSVQAEAALLLSLMNRLGIDSDDALEDMQNVRALWHASVRALGEFPEALDSVVDELRSDGRSELADALRSSVGRSAGLAAVRSIRHDRSE